MPITIFSPHSGNPVKVRDQDAGRAVKDEAGRIFYVLPKSDGNGYYGALTRSGNPKEEARAKEFEDKVAVARGEVHTQVEAVAPAHAKGSGLRGKILVGSAAVVVAVLVWLFSPLGPLSAKSLWQTSGAAPPPPREIPVDVLRTEIANGAPHPGGADEAPKIGRAKSAGDPHDPDLMILPSGLKYKITHAGTGAPVQFNDHVQVRYTGWLSSGAKWDATGPDSDFTLTVGARRNLPFWNQALQGMIEGEIRTLIVPPELAYGSQGNPPLVPPNETLKYEVELVHIIPR